MQRQMKQLMTLATLILITTALLACGSKEVKVEHGMGDAYKDAPEWVFNPADQPGIAAVGVAKIGKAGFPFARNAAIADGRDQLARQLEVKVKNMLKSFTQSTGIGDAQTVETVSSQVSRQVSKQTLNGSRMKQMWRAPTDELFALVVLDPQRIIPALKDSVKTSMKNDEALWQQFQAKKAQDELEAEIESAFAE